jgi:hypothetical protein
LGLAALAELRQLQAVGSMGVSQEQLHLDLSRSVIFLETVSDLVHLRGLGFSTQSLVLPQMAVLAQ